MNALILGFPTEDTDASFSQWGGGGGCSTNSRRIERSSSHTPARVSGCLSYGIARHAGRCWRWSSCVLISSRIYGELSSLCVWITVHFGGTSVTFEYCPGPQHANTDGLSRQCGQCLRPGCLVSSPDTRADDTDSTAELLDQPFASSEMGDSMDADLLPELSGETWLAATYLEELTADLPSTDSDLDFIVASRRDETLTTVRQWVQTGAPPAWPECSGLSPELRCWWLQFRNLSVDMEGRLWRRRAPPVMSSQLVLPAREHQDLIRRYHDSLFAGHLGVSRTVYWLLDRVYWPGLRQDVRSYLATCSVCLAWKSPCLWQAPMGHVEVGHRWDRVAMDILDMSVTTPKGNHYVMVDCFSRWTEACLLPNKTALALRCVLPADRLPVWYAGCHPF